jgi:hypothetical protein
LITQTMLKLPIPYNKKYFLQILLLIYSLGIHAQKIIPLNDNPTIRKYLEEHKFLKKSAQQTAFDTLGLPFFEDFSKISVYPDSKLWEDNDAFINATFPVEPVTYGVATLDALDSKGNVYNIGTNPTSCDKLTSRPINLSVYAGLSNSIYLSFFYQAQGNGEEPEPKDSLVVEFYSPEDSMWISSWSTPGIPLGPFQQQIIKIPEKLYQNGFKFRFRNYVSMSASDTKYGAGALGNFDIWNLDYIRLNNNSFESHQKVYDISIINPLKSSFLDYQSIPWDHVDTAAFNHKRAYIPVTIRMNNKPPGTEDTLSIGRGYFMKNVRTDKYIIEPFEEGYENLWFDTIYTREDAFLPVIRYDGTGTGIIETGAFLLKTGDNFKSNDTVRRIEYFQNHYAYDDGTPERGFGNPGPAGGTGSIILVHFEIYRTDFLRAIDIYFNKTRDNFTKDQPFSVCVFKYDRINLLPDELIYSSENIIHNPGGFNRIILDSAIFIKDDICVGIIQNTDEFLNIGYDINNKNKKQIFINNYGVWESLANSSEEDGSLMIRPVMSRNPIALGIKETSPEPVSGLIITPNPATDYINLNFENSNPGMMRVSIYDAGGNLKYFNQENSPHININDLASGIFIIKVVTSEGESHTARFIITR